VNFCLCSTLYGGYDVNILYVFNAFYSGCSKVAVVNFGISVLQRYLKQTNLDTEEAHRRAGPVDNGEL